MTRRFDFHIPGDPPEIVAVERLEAIATDFDRIADELEEAER